VAWGASMSLEEIARSIGEFIRSFGTEIQEIAMYVWRYPIDWDGISSLAVGIFLWAVAAVILYFVTIGVRRLFASPPKSK
jgi:hypothetical protein